MKHLLCISKEQEDDLLESLVPRVKNGTLSVEDIENCFILFSVTCNNSDDICYEIKDMNQICQFDVGDQTFTIAFENGKCNAYSGCLSAPTVIFTTTPETAIDIVMGNVDSSVAQMNADILYTGPRQDKLAFQAIFELFLDEYI